ncbi:Crp/Fnr family transcriptional regulator [Methylobacterium sp. E-016]|jgi:CRP-like cAMP-binding protein|uniref:Crp/Fnr family transcriptional regulator n=1 Tax=Methylobacterium sp. E-016 TaxID=2836556 RepID=UPI001FBB4BB8|nr:Crp/Fnr family transcriptional regulator [Methylobacterium sp. E-016]MCJ2078858.1 Crp/Fnr family transcriptional regulator [Methylobacterium sp. E-016]
MPKPIQHRCLNHLLSVLIPDDFALLKPHLDIGPLAIGEILITANTAIPRVWFVEQGIVSIIAAPEDAGQIELGLVGREGMVGVPVVLDAGRSPDEGRVQMAGMAWSMPCGPLRDALRDSPRLHDSLLRYAQAANVQVASTALANGRYRLEQRLARWLLMCHDRVDGDLLPTTHRFLSLMMGVNRTGLTTAVATLERARVIGTRRGTITVRSRDTLLKLAGKSYGVAEAEYVRLVDGE